MSTTSKVLLAVAGIGAAWTGLSGYAYWRGKQYGHPDIREGDVPFTSFLTSPKLVFRYAFTGVETLKIEG